MHCLFASSCRPLHLGIMRLGARTLQYRHIYSNTVRLESNSQLCVFWKMLCYGRLWLHGQASKQVSASECNKTISKVSFRSLWWRYLKSKQSSNICVCEHRRCHSEVFGEKVQSPNIQVTCMCGHCGKLVSVTSEQLASFQNIK